MTTDPHDRVGVLREGRRPASPRRGRAVRVVIAAAITMAALAGCQSGATGSDPSNPRQVEIVTWWTADTDERALHDLIGVFESRNPGIDVIDASVSGEGGAEARAAIASRLEAGNAPDIVQVSAGAALTGYVASGSLQDLSELAVQLDLAHFRPDLLDLLRVDGRTYAVPVGVHRANVLWSNRQVLADAGVDAGAAPADLDAWVADLERVRASGVRFPLALGNGLTQLQLFESVLLSRLGPDAYRALWSPSATWSDPAIGDAVAAYARLLEFADPADSARDESATINDAINGDAAYVVMAAYAERQFQQAKWRFGRQYAAHPVPGTDGVFDVAADAFAIPVGAVHQEAALAWLVTSTSVEGQLALTLTKGSLPARFDVSTVDYPDYQRSEIASLAVDALVPSLSQGVAVPARWADEISAALVEFRTGGRVGVLLDRLESASAPSEHPQGG
jgi:glucose/mannose transport system substrate-binding protein